MKNDFLIKDTQIIDGTGQPGFLGSIAINEGRISGIHTGLQKEYPAAGRVIDGTGLVTCPGFIDVHGHADVSLLNEPAADNFLLQGITTTVGGHCGVSMAPSGNNDFIREFAGGIYNHDDLGFSTFRQWLDVCASRGTGVNYVPLVGAGMIRGAILGNEYCRASDDQEIQLMKELLFEALEAGAFGMSVSHDAGTPGQFADEAEMLELLRIVRDFGCVFAPHTRHHQYQWFAGHDQENTYGIYVGERGEMFAGRYHGLLEAIEYTRQTPGLRTMISHMTPVTIIPQPHPDYLDTALTRASLEEIIDKPRNDGLDISFNVIPCEYSVGCALKILDLFFPTSQMSILPDFLRAAGKEGFIRNLKDSAFRRQVIEMVLSGRFKFWMFCPAVDPYWSACFKIHKSHHPEYTGQTVYEIACSRSPNNCRRACYQESVEVLLDILERDPEAVCVSIQDKRESGVYMLFMNHPMAMPCTDNISISAVSGSEGGLGISPSAFGMMPHFLTAAVRQTGMMELAEAIRKSTSLPASVMGIPGRGIIAEGNWADLVMLDWDNLKAHHDFDDPRKAPDGLPFVFVNGQIACENKKLTRVLSGKVLRKNNK